MLRARAHLTGILAAMQGGTGRRGRADALRKHVRASLSSPRDHRRPAEAGVVSQSDGLRRRVPAPPNLNRSSTDPRCRMSPRCC